MSATKITLPERKATKIALVKGDAIYSWFLNSYHECGCRLRTDNKLVWCSGVECNHIETKQSFLDRTGFDGKEKSV
jgi:hypothetical protein